MLMFQNPRDYWDSYNLPTVKWVSLRLRCLLGSLIKLSNLPNINCATLIVFPAGKHYSDEEATNILQSLSQYEKLYSIEIRNL